jgi:hypothetical protein
LGNYNEKETVTMKKVLAILAAAMVAGLVSASTVELKPLSTAERASMGATHYAEFTKASFGTAATNTAEVFTNTVPAKRAVEFVGMVLNPAFEGLLTPTNHPATSLALKIGDGSDDDLFMASTELASDGTEVFVKYGPPNAYTITPTLSKTAITNDVINQVVTNVTAAATAGELGRQTFNSAGIIRFTFTPDADEATDDMSSGSVRVYFKVFDPTNY